MHFKIMISLSSLIFFIACGGHGQGGSSSNSKKKDPLDLDYPSKLETESKKYWVSYVPDPENIPFLDFFKLKVKLSLKDGGRPKDGIMLDVDADMPEHKHGMNVLPKVSALGEGSFLVEGMKFHMLGYWEILLKVIKEGEKVDKVTFKVFID